MLLCFLLFSFSSGEIIPNNGWGGTINLNSYPDSVCTISGVKQTLLNKCAITCSGTSTILVKVSNSKGTEQYLYNCVTKPTLTSSDKTTLYASIPYNLTLTGTGFYDKTSLCALGTSTFSTVFINSLTVTCVYTSIKSGTYTLTILPNSVDSIGSISVKVLTSYRVGSIYALSPYVPTTFSVIGSNLDSDLSCNFSSSAVKVTVVSSSNVTCTVPSGLIGNLSVWMQTSAGMNISSKYYVMTYDKINLRLANPLPCTQDILYIEYTGNILETVFCIISGIQYSSVFNSKIISCLISGLAEGDYTVYIKDSSIQISSNSLSFYRRLNSFEASFEENNGDVLVTVNSTLSIPKIFCKWGYNDPLVMVNTGTQYNCPISNVKDKGSWCVELSYDGNVFTSDCLYVYTLNRNSNFIGISPSEVVVWGGVIEIFSTKLYNESYACVINGTTVGAVLGTDVITCELPGTLESGDYLLEVTQNGNTITEFTVTYVDFVEVTLTTPVYTTYLTTSILLTGRGFYSEIACYFNELLKSCTYHDATTLECSLPSLSSDIVFYCLNIDSSPSLNYTLQFRPIPSLSKSLPSVLFEGISNLLYIQGESFSEASSIKISCDEDNIFSATFIDSSIISLSTYLNYCSPNSTISLSVSPNWQDYSLSIFLDYSPIPNLALLSFYSSPYFGGDLLKFYGNGFVNEIFCNFAGILVLANITSYEEGNCIVPYHDIGTVDFFLEIVGLDYKGNVTSYTFDDLVEFTLSPDTGVSSGGTTVKLIGNFQSATGEAVCLFGDIEVNAVNNGDVTCVAPGGQGKVVVKYIADGKLYSSYIPVYFTYVVYPNLSLLTISSSPSLGNSTIIISGTGFTTEYHWQCRFGVLYSEVIYLNSTYILCYSPGQVPTSTEVGITINGQDFSNFLPFTYTPDISVTSISPAIGPPTGSTTVTISGKNLGYAIYCKVDTKISTGITSNTGIQCITPTWWYGPAALEISTNGIDFTRSQILFNFYNDLQVTNIWPRSVPNTGSSVIITGNNFPSGLRCRVGTIENAVIYTNGNLNCTIPATTQVSIELTANSQNYITFAEVTTLSTYPAPVLTSVSQPFGVINSYIKLTATGLINATSFETSLGVQTYYRFISTSSVIFKVPDQVSGTYNLIVSNNGFDRTTLSSIVVSDVPQVIRIAPRLANIQGGTVFQIKVFNAISTSFLTCMFAMDYEQSLSLYNSYIVSATYINSTHITCTSPLLPYPGLGYLRVSNDNQTFSSSNGTIEFIDTCKDRVLCTGNLIQSCPTGSYCLESFWYSALTCPLGYFQNLTLQTSCKPCPVGQVCTSPIIPSSCNSNYTCGQNGLVYPDFACPNGYYCDTNTSVATRLCAKGNYCIGNDYACMDGYICKLGASSYYGESACPEGFFCVGYSITPCPPRFFCNGQGNTYPTPCQAGTYNPYLAQKNCTICPLGQVCPHERMLFPMSCPVGYICDEEGISFPIKLCTPGYYCQENVATAYTEYPCFGITTSQALDSSICGYDILLLSLDPTNLSGNTTNFNFTQQDLCCWNNSKTANFMGSINSKRTFQVAAQAFVDDGLIGFNLYTPEVATRRQLFETSLYLADEADQELFDFFLTQLLDMKMPTICQSGVFCLEGVAVDTIDDTLVRVAKICNPGTYCIEGSSTPAGILCPSGYHCPTGSTEPTPNDPGTSTGFEGNVVEGPCSPNTFTNQEASQFCYNCPDGYECTQSGTIWPLICLLGMYRNYLESSICSECPLSSYSYDFGIASEKECLACDAGRMCLLAGTYNISLSSACTQGDYCEEAADTSKHEKCPPGFLCDSGTTPDMKYDIPCIGGFYCPSGTKYLNKYLYPCPNNYYCPPGTWDYSVFYADPGASNATSWETPPTICALGTGKVSEGSRTNLLMCEMLGEYSGANPVFEINPIISEISANYTIYQNNDTEAFIFHLESREVALVTFDFLHISSQMLDYGIDWAVGFTILPVIDNATIIDPVPMPQSFLRPSVVKTAVLEFSILAWTAVDFRVSILIYNGIFHTYGNLFTNTTSVEIFTANRENYGTHNTFLAMIDSSIALPFNIPNVDIALSYYLLGFSPSPERSDLERIEKVNDENWFQPNTKYWGDNTEVYLPYFPFFSNCKGYGQYIPIWAPFEVSPQCVLIEPSATQTIVPFAFGTVPVADSCIGIEIECIYDELIGDAQASPRWFEAPLMTPIFYLTQDAITDDDFINLSFNSKLIPVTTFNEVPAGQLPAVIDLQVLYQQFDKEVKKNILIIVTFLNVTSLTADQQSGIAQTPYTLTITYRGMSQKELLVNFVFDYTFYFTLFVLVGAITVLFAWMMWIYHWIFTDIKPRPKFMFFNYFILILRPPFEGFILAFLPVFVVFIINSVLVIGYLLGDLINVAGNEPTINNGIFDALMPTYKDFTLLDGASIQRARLGTSLVAMGAYITWVGCSIFILDDPDEASEEPKGNLWSYVKWKRMNMCFASMIGIACLQGLVQLSYSAVFGLYSYIFIVVLFVAGTILEYFIIQMLSDEILVEPINQAVGMVTGVATFGASDFVNFLVGYFVGLMNLLVMRLYLDFFNDWVIGLLESFADKVENLSSSITDVNSYRSFFSKSENLNRIDSFGDEVPIIKEPDERNVLEYYDSDQDEVEEENSYYTYEDVLPSPIPSVEESEQLGEQEIEALLGSYIGYSGDLLGYYYNPIFTIMCWNYYDYIPFFSAYGIAKPDVFLYVMFGTVMIPFQLATDIILNNANELYNGWAVHDFLDFMRHKYANRKKRWIGNDPQNEEIIEEPIRNVYRLCFSPHFFFASTIFDSGFSFASIGFVTILNNPGYNAFDDRATISIIIFSVVLCYIIHKITIYIGNYLRIWEIQNVDEAEEEAEEPEEPVDVIELFNEIYNTASEDRIVPPIANWHKIELVKADDEVIRRELDSEKLADENIREKFLEVNKEWMRKNLPGMFANENFIDNRSFMLAKLASMYGFLTKKAEIPEFPELLPENFETIESPPVVNIAKYWLSRARRNRKLFAQVAEVIQQRQNTFCGYCGSLYTLQCELFENIEDLFFAFKKTRKPSERNRLHEWRIKEWQKFVMYFGHFRTLCLDCSEKCESFNIYSAETFPRVKVFKKVVFLPRFISPSSKKILKKWVDLARKNLKSL